MTLPFDGAISQYFQTDFPPEMRKAVKKASKSDLITPDYPYDKRLDLDDYEDHIAQLQIELVKLQTWIKATGARIAMVFEGRDASGKGGTIKRFRENLNPRGARVAALSKPSETERGQWYFQRYINHLPTAGEIVFFDRSWYNRGVVEPVFGFCDSAEQDLFYQQVRPFEKMLVDDGIHLIKLWLNVGRAEQMRRFLKREKDPLKQWKLSPIDVKGLTLWDEYSDAIGRTLGETHTADCPWTILRTDDKRRARIAAIQMLLGSFDYAHKNSDAIGTIDPQIAGGPDLWHG